MRLAGTIAATLIAGLASSASPPSLHVLRTAPADPAEPGDIVTVVFDRPVAGQLDGTVDPHTLFRIDPAVPGRLEWRDPITVRFTPDAPLTPNTTYTVSIANSFQAMDGSRLDAPFQFSFRIGGPRVLTGSPAHPYSATRFVRPGTPFEIVVSAPAELPLVSELVHIETSRCAGNPVIRLAAISQRPISKNDPSYYRYAGGANEWNHDRRTDDLRRVIRLAPERPLPLDCSAQLVAPSRIDRADTGTPVRWDFATYGPFRLQAVACTNSPMCPAGWATLQFSTPVKGSDVLHAVHISLSLATTGVPGPGVAPQQQVSSGDEEGGDAGDAQDDSEGYSYGWFYGSWDGGWWSPFDHREMHDDRVSWVATYLWPGTYTTSYLARATTPGIFFRPPAHAEEMYNPGAQGRSDGGLFTVTRKP